MFMWRKRCPISVLDIGVEGYEEIIRWSSKYIKHSFPFVNCLCWRNEVEQRAFSASLSSLSQSCGWFAAFGHQLDQPGRGCSCGRLINSLQKPARAGKGASPRLTLLYGWTLLVPLTLEELVGLLAPWGWEEIFMALTGVTWGVPQFPWAQESHFSSAQVGQCCPTSTKQDCRALIFTTVANSAQRASLNLMETAVKGI